MSENVEEILYSRVRKDLDVFRKNKDRPSLDAVRFILGEIQRDPKKNYKDSNVTKIMTLVRKNMSNLEKPDHLVMSLVSTYIGFPVASGEVIEWLHAEGYDKEKIMDQVNPFAIIGILKKAFGSRELDGNMVKDILAKIISDIIVEEKPVMIEDIPGDGLMQSMINEMYPNKDVFGKKNELL